MLMIIALSSLLICLGRNKLTGLVGMFAHEIPSCKWIGGQYRIANVL